MNQDLSILHLVLNASLVVQLVMLLLVVVSVTSWAAIFRKLFALKRVKSLNDDFEREFWSGTSLNDLLAAATQNAKQAGPMERIFASGMREFQKLRERRISDAGTLLDGARRAMRASYQRELDAIETNLSFLASVGLRIAVCGPVWHGVGHHARLHRPGQPAAGHARFGGARHCRSPGRHGHRPVRGHSCGRGLQPLCTRHRPRGHQAGDLHRGVLQHPAAQRGRACRVGFRSLTGTTMPAVTSRGRGRRTINEINMVPFIDVMLVLLIIFMVTAPLITPSLIDLPSVGKASKQPDQVLQIVIGKDESLEFKNQDKTTRLGLNDIANAVRQAQGTAQGTVRRPWSSVPTAASSTKPWSRSWTPCNAPACSVLACPCSWPNNAP